MDDLLSTSIFMAYYENQISDKDFANLERELHRVPPKKLNELDFELKRIRSSNSSEQNLNEFYKGDDKLGVFLREFLREHTEDSKTRGIILGFILR